MNISLLNLMNNIKNYTRIDTGVIANVNILFDIMF